MSYNINQKVDIIGIPIFAGRFKEAVDIVLNNFTSSSSNCISATGAHGIVHSSKDIKFKKILQGFFLNLPDGMPNVWIGRLKGKKEMERCYGPDFFAKVLKKTADTDINHFFCGGKEGVADKLKATCEDKFNNKNIVGTYCPPFLQVDHYDYKEIGQIINKTHADIIWIGLSTPKQEFFANNLSKYTQAKFIIAVGAAFDFHIGKVKQAPFWIQNIGMEWFFRLIMEPKRLWKRYFEIVPLFIYYNFVEIVKQKFFN